MNREGSRQPVDFETITACGESCASCLKKAQEICPGCLEADGYVPEWEDSGRCRVHACAREHNAPFCGLCKNFPCSQLTSVIHWNPEIVSHMEGLAKQWKERRLELGDTDKEETQ